MGAMESVEALAAPRFTLTKQKRATRMRRIFSDVFQVISISHTFLRDSESMSIYTSEIEGLNVCR